MNMTDNSKNNAKSTTTKRLAKLVIALVVITILGTGGYFVYNRIQNGQDSESEQLNEDQRVPVVTTPATIRNFERTLVVQGNVEAKNFALVSPRIPGIVEAIFVDEGDSVITDETKLFQTDAAKLKENVEIRHHDLTVAQCARQQAEANLEKTQADLHKVKLDYDRLERLLEKEAVTTDAFEQQKSKYLQLQASEKLALAQVKLAAAQEDQARAALEIAKKDLADATIYAPISGKVSKRLREPGEMGSPGQPVLRIDDTSVVEVAAFLPAQYYSSIIPSQTKMKVQVGNINLGQNIITYKSPTIESKLRTFEIKSLITVPPEGVAPGAMAQIVVILETRQGLGVPSVAIQQRGGHNVVFTVKDNISNQVIIQTGIEMDGWTEIREGQLDEVTDIVTMGQYMIEDGTRVTVQKEVE
jgi:multidrug efflux pump subunit AcrA (membrane-fusion protein)